MASKSLEKGDLDQRAPVAPVVSRRSILRKGAVAVGGGAATLLAGGTASGSQARPSSGQTPANRQDRVFRAFVRYRTGASLQQLKLHPIGGRQVVIRTEASQCCYSVVNAMLGTANTPDATIIGHGGVGIVEEIGPMVKRVQVGDRVIVPVKPQCGACYQCLRGRGDQCAFSGGERPLTPFAEMQDGTPVLQVMNIGGPSELMVVFEEWCCPVFTQVPAVELSMLGCVAGTGLAAGATFVPIDPGSDVVVLGAWPVGLAAVQAARIKGAAQVIVVEPIKYRRDVALKVGATTVLDPNAEGDKLLETIRELCKGPTDRRFAGGRNWAATAAATGRGPDFIFEAVGGDQFPPTVERGPDPTGLLSLQQAWDLIPGGGHLVTLGVGQSGNVTFPAGQWSNRGKTHHGGQYGGVSMMRDLPTFVRLIEHGLFDAKSLATSTFPLERTREAFQAVANRTTVAAVIVFD